MLHPFALKQATLAMQNRKEKYVVVFQLQSCKFYARLLFKCTSMFACALVYVVQVLPINRAALAAVRIDIYSINLLLPPAATATTAQAAAAIFHS